jgi:hypothetical protein
MVFCAVYVVTGTIWLLSALQALVLDWFIFELIQPIGLVGIRVICKKFDNLM